MKFSVIVPVYNVEDYLKKCLDSIIGQTYTNFEIIIVNDGSKDNSQQIIDEYAQEYPSLIKALKKENGGLSDARNFGVKKATGDYILFVDSDDYINKELLEKLNEVIVRDQEPEIISFDAQVIHKDKKENTIVSKPDFSRLDGETAIDKFINNKQYFEPACFFAYNLKFWKKNKFAFQKGKYHEDFGLIPEVIVKTKAITSINFIGYYYLQREGSITKNNSKTKEKVYDILYFVDHQLIIANTIKNEKIRKNFCSYIANTAINQIEKLPINERRDYKKELKKRKIFDKILDDNILRKLKKVYLKIKNI